MKARLQITFVALAAVTACNSGATVSPSPTRRLAHPGLTREDPAYVIAAKVAWHSGMDQLERVAQLDFRFVVLDGEARIFEAHHRWDRKNGRDRITWTDREGKRYDAILDIASKSARGTVDGAAPSEGEAAAFSEKAHARYINDTYWLVLPLKLFDPGSRLERQAPREWAGKPHEVLQLSFDDVGLTPGDVYWLFVDPDAFRIARWEMVLQGSEPPAKGYSFADYRPVGPLLLAHDHVSDDGARRIAFEDTKAHRAVQRRAFVLPTSD